MHMHSIAIEICVYICSSIKRIHCDNTNDTSAHIFMQYERSIIWFF